jgi:hypothetical protein
LPNLLLTQMPQMLLILQLFLCLTIVLRMPVPGCILLFMLSGELAFKADSQPELFSKIQKGSFSVPMYCSPEASDLVHSLIQVLYKQPIANMFVLHTADAKTIFNIVMPAADKYTPGRRHEIEIESMVTQVKPAKRLAIGQCWQHAWLATKRFEFSFDDEDLEQV